MEIKKNSIIVTKEGEYVLKDWETFTNPFTFEKRTVYMVNNGDKDKIINESEIVSVKNAHQDMEEEP